jgi:hypothetical protein
MQSIPFYVSPGPRKHNNCTCRSRFTFRSVKHPLSGRGRSLRIWGTRAMICEVCDAWWQTLVVSSWLWKKETSEPVSNNARNGRLRWLTTGCWSWTGPGSPSFIQSYRLTLPRSWSVASAFVPRCTAVISYLAWNASMSQLASNENNCFDITLCHKGVTFVF